jgi:hypothetical protein
VAASLLEAYLTGASAEEVQKKSRYWPASSIN